MTLKSKYIVILLTIIAVAPLVYAEEIRQTPVSSSSITDEDDHGGDSHDDHGGDSHDDHGGDSHDDHGGDSHDDHGGDSHDDHGGDSHDDHGGDSHDDHGGDSHDDISGDSHDDHGDENSVSLKPDQISIANIEIKSLDAQRVGYEIYAPGEILTHGYTSYRVSPRVPSVVIRRHVALGDHVNEGQPLVTLFSERVAQTQSEYRIAWPEWERVQRLGKKTVGDQRYVSAKANLETARATLISYGLENKDLQLLHSKDSVALGEYTLKAEINGAVLADGFEQGQRIEAGASLITLADEKKVWVEAHLPANLTLPLAASMEAIVVTGDIRLKAYVTQEAHTINPVTRTRTVRLEVDNTQHLLHPGQFSEVYFKFKTQNPVLTVPETALMRSDSGAWTVFVEDHPGEFKSKNINLGRSLGVLREITGIEPGTRTVVKGAFFVASQIAKGGFDPHNH